MIPRIELIHGFLVRKMVKNPPHVVATGTLNELLEPIVPPGWHIRKEDPVRIPPSSEPEPDLAIVAGTKITQSGIRVAEVAHLVEVSESSLEHDRGISCRHMPAGASRFTGSSTSSIAGLRSTLSRAPPATHQISPGQEIVVVIAGVECGRIAVSDILP